MCKILFYKGLEKNEVVSVDTSSFFVILYRIRDYVCLPFSIVDLGLNENRKV